MDFRSNGGSAPSKQTNAPAAATAPARHTPTQQPKRRFPLATLVIIIVVLLLAVGGWFGVKALAPSTINGGQYQAVFFTNGQVYFGKLQKVGDAEYKLTKVFYLQSKETAKTEDSKNPQDAASQNTPDVELIKLGSEIHGPNDEMIINRDQVLFYENLKKDGTVAQSIEKYYTQNKQ